LRPTEPHRRLCVKIFRGRGWVLNTALLSGSWMGLGREHRVQRIETSWSLRKGRGKKATESSEREIWGRKWGEHEDMRKCQQKQREKVGQTALAPCTQ
jgi:hypothetical protein